MLRSCGARPTDMMTGVNTLKSLLIALALAVGSTLALAPMDAGAKRLGGGKAAGMQRQTPAKPADATPGTPATPAAAPGAQAAAPAAAGAAAAAGKRSWMGPLAGLAAGLGLAALFSHLGMGEGLANFVMIALLVVVAFVAIRFLMRRFAGGQRPGGLQMAGAGAPVGGLDTRAEPSATTGLQRQALAPQAVTPAVGGTPAGQATLALPGGVDPADFARIAKQVFIRLQAANDAGDVDDLRRFTTPELFASLRADLLERGAAKQQTDVVQLDAEVVDVAQDGGRDVVSVRFHGLIREQAEAGAEPLNEVWHLVRPTTGGDWAIAGITPLQ
jgi:predicted lipid-binding transport protein (Tim44 family)